MKKLLCGLATAAITAIPAFLVVLAGCRDPCGCPAPADAPFPTSGSYELSSVREFQSGPVRYVEWDESSWADVTTARLDVGEDQLVVTLELASGITTETVLDITSAAFRY